MTEQTQLVPATTAYDRVPNTLEFCQQMAKSYAIMTRAPIDMGPAIVAHCMLCQISPAEFSRTFHIIQGRIEMKAGAILARFRQEFGGEFEFIESTPERAAIEVTTPTGKKHLLECTWEEMEASRWPWKNPGNHNEGLKDNWSTPTDRRDMLWNRMISSNIPKICPEITFGSIGEFDSEAAEEAMSFVANVKVEQPEEQPAAEEADVVEVEAEVVEETDERGITVGQASKIDALFKELGFPAESIDAVLEKRGADSIQSLEFDTAAELIEKLEDMKASAKK